MIDVVPLWSASYEHQGMGHLDLRGSVAEEPNSLQLEQNQAMEIDVLISYQSSHAGLLLFHSLPHPRQWSHPQPIQRLWWEVWNSHRLELVIKLSTSPSLLLHISFYFTSVKPSQLVLATPKLLDLKNFSSWSGSSEGLWDSKPSGRPPCSERYKISWSIDICSRKKLFGKQDGSVHA